MTSDSVSDRDGEDREDGLSAQASQSGDGKPHRPKRYYAKSSNEESNLRKQLSNERADTAILVEALEALLLRDVTEIMGTSRAERFIETLKWPKDGPRSVDIRIENARKALSKIQSSILIRGDGDE